MNTETQLPRHSPRSAIRAAVLVALFALAPAAAFADLPAAPAATRVAKVSLVGLDLSTAEGARAAYERLKTVAERLCFLVGDDPYREVYDACVRETLANAVRRMNTPALAAAQESLTAR
jgi:UrcA family protein